jgi:peptidoglycan/LPS O-acetylase OafA/YrhL
MTQRSNRLIWIDQLKAVALAWIFLSHASERLLGSPYMANPSSEWPPLARRIRQLYPLSGFGVWNLPVNLFRYVGWLGDQGVSLFLILSGFGLVWGYLSRDPHGPIRSGEFYRRRVYRIYPLWLSAHICFLLPLAFIGLHVSLINSAFYASVLGIRIMPSQLYFGVPAWWFVALILQLYLIFPFLWKALQNWGATRFFVIIGGGSLLIRAGGLFYFHHYLDAWSRGAIFITRLPEFAAGMGIAVLMQRRGTPNRAMLGLLGSVSFAIATLASFTLAGMTIVPLLGGLGIFAVLYAIFVAFKPRLSLLDWIGRHSLSLYLAHEPFVDALLPKAGSPMSPKHLAVGFVLVIAGTIVAALFLERFAATALRLLDRARQRWGNKGLLWRMSAATAAIWAILIAAGLAVQKWDPQEPVDMGWGERAALQPSQLFGWNLKPSRQTHLRWESYDYHVTANSLGFPGPEYTEQKPPGTFRILVTGDAFTSAEGVDTDLSWPRLLEQRLAESRGVHPQVLNFAITGYGPNQYLAVVKEFAPRYHPDLILIGLFVNDYADVLESDDEFRTSIGFRLPSPNGLAAILTFRQLGSVVRNILLKNIHQEILHKPDPLGYQLGQFHFIESNCPELSGEGRRLMADRLTQIKQLAGSAPVVIAMIPCAAQVADPSSIAYWPQYVDLSDPARFDTDLPQRVTQQIADSLSIRCYDLRPPLREAGNVYQPHNMHWTALGHQIAANYLAATLRTDGYLKTVSP